MTVINIDKKYVFIRVFKTGSGTVGRELKKNDPDATVVTSMMRAADGFTGDGLRRTSHVKSSWIKENIFAKMDWDWDEYFKFGFVRNPWERELSNYFWNRGHRRPAHLHADGKKTPRGYFFKEFLNHRLLKDGQMDQANLLQCDYLTDVDYIARFENFEEEVKYIFNRIDVPLAQKICHRHKTEHKPYWEYYDDADIMKVEEWYKKDIEMYNYEFGE
jgi:hypothetical protein